VRDEEYEGEKQNIVETIRFMEHCRRRGFRAVVESASDDRDGLIHSEISNGPVLFEYHPELDLERDSPLYRLQLRQPR